MKRFFYDNADMQAQRLADEIAALLLKDIRKRGVALLILAGGSSPCKLITNLAKKLLPWDNVQITLTDERRVPLDSEYSNYGQVVRLFKEQGVDIAPVSLLGDGIKSLNFPATVTVLGMGLDGHIASLFPAQNHSCEDSILINALAPAEPKSRISLTMEALLDTNHLILLVNGQGKRDIIENKLDQDLPVSKLISLAKDNLRMHIC